MFTEDLKPRRLNDALWSLNGFCEAYDYETILPYSQDVFTQKQRTETLNGRSTPLGQDNVVPHISKHQRIISAQIHSSASPEQFYLADIHETSFQGLGMNQLYIIIYIYYYFNIYIFFLCRNMLKQGLMLFFFFFFCFFRLTIYRTCRCCNTG